MKKLTQNKSLFWLGTTHLFIFLVLCLYFPFNHELVLGINSVIKPMKFALSIWFYSWTMALILNHVTDTRKVKIYSWVAVITMCFEQAAITYQALRGQLSHFNTSTTFGIILFSVMGVFILTITLWTVYITYIFFKQKKYNLHPTLVTAIKISLIYFTVFSLFGGYISALKGHTIGGEDGSDGLVFLNWSKVFGDLRVAHFFGIHSLQVIPLVAIICIKFLNAKQSFISVWVFSLIYLTYVCFTMLNAFQGHPF